MNKYFDYPFDALQWLRKKKSLRRDFLQTENLQEKRIAILGGSTTDEVADMLELHLLARGIKPVIYQSPYNQFYQEALFPSQALLNFKPDVVYLHTTRVNISEFPRAADTTADVDLLLQDNLQHFTASWHGIHQHLGCPVIQNNFEEPWNRPLGNLDGSDYRGRSRFTAKLNEALADTAMQNAAVHIHDIHYLSARIGIDNWFNPQHWYLYKYALAIEQIPHLAHSLAAMCAALWGLSKKCLVLDLDNTLWGGVIGDDGADGITIGTDNATAEAYADMQRYARELKERGIVLAACSKNDDSNARAGFSHPQSILQVDDFAAFCANWDPKPQNLQAIASQLQIGIDSLVFVDDNPVERDMVRQHVPAVRVPEVGDNIVDFIRILDQAALFETAALSAADISRAQQYRDNQTRLEQQNHFASHDDFLASLQMTANIHSFDTRDLERIAQLTNKTNQFNLTTERHSLADIKKMACSAKHITQSARLADKFGDNGLVSVIAGEIIGCNLHIHLWLMSCRVLNRGLEFAMLEYLCTQARQQQLHHLIGYYRPTAKNSMVANFYPSLGFSLLEENAEQSSWQFNIDTPPTIPRHFIHIHDKAPNETR